MYLQKAGFRMRIHLIRIRIQHIRLNTVPIRIRIQSGSNTDPGFLRPKIEKNLQGKKSLIFLIKNYNLPIPRPP
jgi:hypothetical protein